MGQAITQAFAEEDAPLAVAASAWITAVYPDISVTIEAGRAVLVAPSRTDTALALIWTSSLVNERLWVAGRQPRAELFAALFA